MPTISSAAAAAKIPLPVKIPESFTTSSPFTGTYRIILAEYEKVKTRRPGERRRAHKKTAASRRWGSRREISARSLFYAARVRVLASRFYQQIVLVFRPRRYADELSVEAGEVPRVADYDAALEHEAYEVLVVRRFD